MDNNIKELNMKYAVEMEPVYSLREHLALKNDQDMASLKALAGTEDIYGWLTDPENFKMLLKAITPADFDLFTRTADQTFLIDEKLFLPRHSALTAFSLMTPFLVKETIYCVVPSELKDLWHDLGRLGFGDYKRKRDMLDAYAIACTKLYGILPLEEYVEIFNQKSGGKTDLKEAGDYCKELADGQYYRLENGLLMISMLSAESAPLYTEARKGIPKYLPQHEKMLQFAEGDYLDVFHEMEMYRLEVEEILKAREIKDAENEAYLFADTLYLTLAADLSDEKHDELFTEFGLTEDSGRIRELKNNVRLWACYGHTPNELFAMIEKGEYKPERNGRCVCGSGIKYKKCHGK